MRDLLTVFRGTWPRLVNGGEVCATQDLTEDVAGAFCRCRVNSRRHKAATPGAGWEADWALTNSARLSSSTRDRHSAHRSAFPRGDTRGRGSELSRRLFAMRNRKRKVRRCRELGRECGVSSSIARGTRDFAATYR